MMDVTQIANLLGMEPAKWMMWPSERLCVLGLLSALKPEQTLELGCANGGLTFWLCQYSKQVVTVDLDPRIINVTQSLENVIPLNMTTAEAFARFEEQGKHFDLTVIDADHSREGVRRDLSYAIKWSKVVVLHDTYYPPCREGMLDVLANQNMYFDLDLVPGGLQPDGLWGGLGIVIPNMPHVSTWDRTPRLTLYPWLRVIWFVRERVQAIRRFGAWIRRKLGSVKRHVIAHKPKSP